MIRLLPHLIAALILYWTARCLKSLFKPCARCQNAAACARKTAREAKDEIGRHA